MEGIRGPWLLLFSLDMQDCRQKNYKEIFFILILPIVDNWIIFTLLHLNSDLDFTVS